MPQAIFPRYHTWRRGKTAAEAAYFFGALETRSHVRKSTATIPEKWLSFWYTTFSNYGQSLWRPVLWWFGINTVVSYLLCLLSGLGTKPFLHAIWADFCLFWGRTNPEIPSLLDTIHGIENSWTYVLRNLMPGAWLRDLTIVRDGTLSDYQIWINTLLADHKFQVYFLAIGHEIVTIALIFLFALALKRRFQIK